MIRPLIGIGIMLFSGLAFSAALLNAVVAIQGGVDLNTSNAIRYLIAAIVIFVYHKIMKRPITLPPLERFTSLALGILVFMMGIGYLGATLYIPVSLAVLIFYTAPFLVFIISRFTEKEPFTLMRLTAFSIAFLGLSLAIGVQIPGGLDIKGVLFAFIGAASLAIFVTISSLTIRTADPQAVNLHALSSGALLFLCFCLLTEGFVNSLTQGGLLWLSSSGIILGIAYITFYIGLKIVGPVKASMIMNVEPIFTIALSVALLGEQFSFIQFFGAGLVIIGIFMITYK